MKYIEIREKLDNSFSPDKRKYADHLREMVACRTISDKDHFSREEFLKLDEVLRKNYPRIFEKCEVLSDDGSTFLRIPGKESASPLLLMSHKDVVHEGKKKWKAPPYAGSIIGGRMYGRGTFDCKGSLCCLFEAVEELLAEGISLSSDLYILSTSTEETGGPDAQNALDWFKSNGIVPGLVIDEGGAILRNPFPSRVRRFAMVGAVERSSARFIFDCGTGEAARKLGKAVKKMRIGRYEITPEVEELAKSLSEYLFFPLGNLAGFLAKNKKIGAAVLSHAGPDARAFCGASTGYGIPSEGEKERLENQYGKLNNPVRISVSGNYYNRIEDLMTRVRVFAEEEGVKFVSVTSREADGPVPSSGAGFRFIDGVAKKVFGNIETLPYPVLGRTDARYFIGYAEDVIRFVPLEISVFQMTKFHCPNENIYVDSLPGAVGFYREAIKQYMNPEVHTI